MKTLRKLTALFICLCLAITLSACNYTEQTNPTEIYGVISFKDIDGEHGMFAFIPLDFCGEVRIYLSKTSSSSSPYESYQEGDLVKLYFEDTPQIRDLGSFQAFWYAPKTITVIKKGVKLEKNGVDYVLEIPSSLVDGEISDKIYCYDGETKKGVFESVIIEGDKVKINLAKGNAHTSLALLNYQLLASEK